MAELHLDTARYIVEHGFLPSPWQHAPCTSDFPRISTYLVFPDYLHFNVHFCVVGEDRFLSLRRLKAFHVTTRTILNYRSIVIAFNIHELGLSFFFFFVFFFFFDDESVVATPSLSSLSRFLCDGVETGIFSFAISDATFSITAMFFLGASPES